MLQLFLCLIKMVFPFLQSMKFLQFSVHHFCLFYLYLQNFSELDFNKIRKISTLITELKRARIKIRVERIEDVPLEGLNRHFDLKYIDCIACTV